MTTPTLTTPLPHLGQTTARTEQRPRRWKATPLLIITALVAVVGATVLAYSPAAQWLTRLNQAAVVGDYRHEVDHADPSARTQLRRAQQYNDALSAGALVAANTNVPTGAGQSTDTSLDYWKMLRTDSGMMARIQIPSIDVDLPIYHGTSQATLLKGAGHLQGTSLPIGGKGTHAVITAHRGLAQARMFTDLDQLDRGDRFTITTFGKVLTYEVTTTKVVQPEDTATLRAKEGKDLVTLVTCTPLGINSHRMLVTGKRVTPTPAKDLAAAQAGPGRAPFPWFAIAYLAALVAIGIYTWRSGRVLAPAPASRAGLLDRDDAEIGVPTGPKASGRSRRARVVNVLTRRSRTAAAAADPRLDTTIRPPATDPLTGLLTRDGLVAELDGATRGDQHNGVALVFVRLDDLAATNSHDGRAGGDAALRALAERVHAAAGGGAGAARISAATFVAVGPDVDDAGPWAERLARSIAGEGSAHPAATTVLIITDGFHHDADLLVADAEAAFRQVPTGYGPSPITLRLGLDSELFDDDVPVVDGSVPTMSDDALVQLADLATGEGQTSGAPSDDDLLRLEETIASLLPTPDVVPSQQPDLPTRFAPATIAASDRRLTEPPEVEPGAGAAGPGTPGGPSAAQEGPGEPSRVTGWSTAADRPQVDADAWLAFSDDDYLTQLRAARVARPVSEEEDRP